MLHIKFIVSVFLNRIRAEAASALCHILNRDEAASSLCHIRKIGVEFLEIFEIEIFDDNQK